MITWVTVWFMVVSNHGDQFTSNSYTIPYSSKAVCLQNAKKINDAGSAWSAHQEAKCVSGQMPVVTK